jgi:hypothetical protein
MTKANTLSEASDEFSRAIGAVRAISGFAADAMTELGYGPGFAVADGTPFSDELLNEISQDLPAILTIIHDELKNRERRIERLEKLTAAIHEELGTEGAP